MARRFQFSVRAILIATAVVAVACWAYPDARVLVRWLLVRPREWQIERNYAKKGGDEVKRLREIQASLPAPDPDVAKKIEGIEWDLNFEPLPESLGGGTDRY